VRREDQPGNQAAPVQPYLRNRRGGSQNDLVAELQLIGCLNMTREILANIETLRSPATCKQIEFFAEVFAVPVQEFSPKQPHFAGREASVELRIITRRRRDEPNRRSFQSMFCFSSPA